MLARIGDDAPGSQADRATDLARAWVASVLADPRRDQGRIATFHLALQRDVAYGAMSDGAAAAAHASRTYRIGRAVLAPARRVESDRAGRPHQS